MKLREIAHSRAGDKGNISNISVIAYDKKDYDFLVKNVTEERVKKHFENVAKGEIKRYTIPTLGALNFVLYDALNGGVVRSLYIDQHGKSLSSIMLDMEL